MMVSIVRVGGLFVVHKGTLCRVSRFIQQLHVAFLSHYCILDYDYQWFLWLRVYVVGCSFEFELYTPLAVW